MTPVSIFMCRSQRATTLVAEFFHRTSHRRGVQRGKRTAPVWWLAALAVAVAPVVVAGDWKGDIARRAVGNAVRAGLADAARDAAKDAALSATLDAAADAIGPRAASYAVDKLDDIDDYVDIGTTVGDGVEAAMRVADVADRLDNVADAAKVVKKVGKLRKLKR